MMIILEIAAVILAIVYKDKVRMICLIVCLLVFNATFNNISVISLRSVLLVEEIVGPGENHRPVYTPQNLDKNSGPVTIIAWNDRYIYY